MSFFTNKNIRPYAVTIIFALLALIPASMRGINRPGYGEDSNREKLNSIKTVVIDPGHGGKDPGTIWGGGRYREKDIVLQVSLRLGEMIKAAYPHIKVLYTRASDKYIELNERSDFANRNKADIFISVHVNATKSTAVSGTETFVMGTHKSESNFELCKAENSVIVLEENYESKYEGFNPNSPESYIIFSLLQNTHLEQSLKLAELMQNEYKKGPVYANRGVKQGGLIVLWRSTMPAVLTEIGFLSNAKDRSTMITKEGQRKIAANIFRAFKRYKESFECGSTDMTTTGESAVNGNVPSDNASNSTIAPKTPAENGGKAQYYSIQILSVGKQLKNNAPDLKGRKDFHFIKMGNTYKYLIGKYSGRAEAAKALQAVKREFKGAFVVKVSDNKIVH